jgi:hypothetical protein
MKKILEILWSSILVLITCLFSYYIYKLNIDGSDLTIYKIQSSGVLKLSPPDMSESNIQNFTPQFTKTLSITINFEELEQLYISTYSIENNGNIPIKPSDFIEPVSISVNKPWGIYYISTTSSQVGLKSSNLLWKETLDDKYDRITLTPTLLNPTDKYYLTLILYKKKLFDNTKTANKSIAGDEPIVSIDGRIVGVKTLFKKPEDRKRSIIEYFQTYIYMAGSDVYYFVIIYLVLFLIQYVILLKGKFLENNILKNLILISLTSILTLSTSEIIIFLHAFYKQRPVWQGSWVLLVLHALFFVSIIVLNFINNRFKLTN